MADFAGVGIRAAIDLPLFSDDAAADASRDRQVKQGKAASSRTVKRFTQRAHVGVVIHHGQNTERLFKLAWQIEVAPAANVSGKRNPLFVKFDGSAESYSASIPFPVPSCGDGNNLLN